MKELSSLITMISIERIRTHKLPGQTGCRRMDGLYSGIADGYLTNDAEAIRDLYTRAEEKSDFPSVKTRLEDALIDTLCLIERNTALLDNPNVAYEEVCRAWAVANILVLQNGDRKTVIDLCLKALDIAQRFEFSSLILQISKLLRKFGGSYFASQDQVAAYGQIYADWQTKAKQEAAVESALHTLMLLLADTAADPTAARDAGRQGYTDYAALLANPPTFKAGRDLHYLRVLHLIAEGAYAQAYTAIDAAVAYCADAPYAAADDLLALHYLGITCAIQTRDYAAGQSRIRGLLDAFGEIPPPSLFKVEEAAFVLALHCGRYQEGYEVCSRVFAHPEFGGIDRYAALYWDTYRACVCCLIGVGEVVPHAEDAFFDPQRKGFFPMDAPQQEEGTPPGLAPMLLVFQTWFALQEGRFDLAEARIAMAGQYVVRCAKTDPRYRFNCLIQMLQEMPKAGFHRAAVERNAALILKRMADVPMETLHRADVHELIPTEALWAHMVAGLSGKRVKVKALRPAPAQRQSKAKPPSEGMQVLAELVGIVSRKKTMRLGVPGQAAANKLDLLFDLAVEDPEMPDDEAANRIYRQGANSIAYQKLKSKLKEKLRDILLFSEPAGDWEKDTYLAYRQSWRCLAVTAMLVRRQAPVATRVYAERMLERALRYEHIELTLEAARLLRRIALDADDRNGYLRYDALYHQHIELSAIESEVEQWVSHTNALIGKQISSYEAVSVFCNSLFERCLEFKNRYPHFSVQRSVRTVEIYTHLYSLRFREADQAAGEAVAFFKAKPFALPSTILSALKLQVEAKTKIKDFTAGQKCMDEASLWLADAGYGLSFYTFYYQAVLFAFYCGQYQIAYEYANVVLGAPDAQQQARFLHEHWSILKAYIQYLILLGKIIPDEEDAVFGHFRHGRFSNEIEVLAKDKSGMNITIRTVQFIFLLALDRRDEAFDQIEAFEKYMYRHVSRDANYRSHYFIKMLLQLPIAGYDVSLAVKMAKPYLDMLNQLPIEEAPQPLEIEIIPYEDLWDLVIESLQSLRS